jgi:hypothetical protein
MAKARFALCGAAVLLFLGTSSVALADCYVDSQSGNDSNDGQSEATAWKGQTAVASSCTVVRYKRGSVFNEALRTGNSASGKTFTNYGSTSDPLPRFVVPHTTSSGSIVSSFQGGLTIDGLYLAGSKGDGTMSGLIAGVCVMLGANSKLLNSEVTNCDIGIMLSGSGSLIQGNYVHDLTMAVDAPADSGTYVNAVGGAEGIFINGSNNEIAYNQFVNCSDSAEWTGGNCDGGATEVAVSAGGTVTGVKVHHNLAYNSCGFFEVSGTGTFSDSQFYYNVAIDSGWMFLLQVNETTLSNIRWENNTIVQHQGSTNAGFISMIYQGTVTPNTVFFNNNLVILDNVTSFGTLVDAAISQSNNLIARLPNDPNPGVVNVAGTQATDFDLVADSAARDQGMTIAGYTKDCLDRVVPDSSGITDIGAFEYGSSGSGAGGRTNWGGSSSGGSSATSGNANATGGSPGEPSNETCSCRMAGGSSGSGRGLVGLLCLGATVLFWRRRPGKVVR